MKEHGSDFNCKKIFPECLCHTCNYNYDSGKTMCCFKHDKDCFDVDCKDYVRRADIEED